ncbi:MAG: hypothetical protein PUJ82_15425 [Spirochaetales bacterium]|nr:hypothetical protein [Spirochaetales bacterium]MDY5915832.1 hypothetical protein [Treponema sp.]
MRNRTYNEDFNLDCVKYCAEHLELSQAEAAKNLNEPEKTLNRWLVMHWNMIFPIITRKNIGMESSK